jgi:hypothetical protein
VRASRARGAIAAARAALAVGLGLAACGSDARPPLLFTGADGTGAGAGAPGGAALGGTDAAPPCCGVGPDGGVCACLDLPILGAAPTLYFVLDRSGSMAEAGKWDTVRSVVVDVMRALGPRATFGAAVFPDPTADTCGPGIEVMTPRRGDTPAGTYGPTSAYFERATSAPASGGTPTAATLTALAPRLAAYPGKTYVILATDGAPNCDAAAACTVDDCPLNIEGTPGCAPGTLPNCCDRQPLSCLDARPTLDAVSALEAAGVDTYVIGAPGTVPYASLLDAMADAGGTARSGSPRYYAVDGTDAAAFGAALKAVAARITATCALTLDTTPPDPDAVNVYLDTTVVPRTATDGWRLDGATITLLGATCAKVLAGDVLDVRIIAGCPTVIR